MTKKNPRSIHIAAVLLSTKQAADYLGISKRTLDRWRWSGSGIPYVRLSGRCIRYRLCDLDTWVGKRVQRSTSEYR